MPRELQDTRILRLEPSSPAPLELLLSQDFTLSVGFSPEPARRVECNYEGTRGQIISLMRKLADQLEQMEEDDA